MEILTLIVGFAIGILIGLTGVGGGALMTPFLVLVLGVPMLTAIGTDLVYAAATKSVGLYRHYRQNSIRWDIVIKLAQGSIPAAIISLVIIGQLQNIYGHDSFSQQETRLQEVTHSRQVANPLHSNDALIIPAVIKESVIDAGVIEEGVIAAEAIKAGTIRDNPATPHQLESIIHVILGFCLLLTALFILFKEPIIHRSAQSLIGNGLLLLQLSQPKEWQTSSKRVNPGHSLFIIGSIIGVLVSLSSIGAGALTAAAILMLYPKLESRTLVGSDLAHALPLALVAGLGHFSLGNVDYHLLFNLLLGSLPGVYLGTHLGNHIPDQWIKRFLAGLLLLLSLQFIFR